MMIKRANNIPHLIFISLALATASFVFVPTYTGAINTTFDARCDACHVSEQEEFSKTEVHKTLICSDCHTISDFGPDQYSHRATTVECTDCHTLQNHQFKEDAHQDGKKMCIACHSHVKIETRLSTYDGVNMTVAAHNGGWEINYTLIGEYIFRWRAV